MKNINHTPGKWYCSDRNIMSDTDSESIKIGELNTLNDHYKGNANLIEMVPIMYKEHKLFEECIRLNYNVSITFQRINQYAVEIYRGYKSKYKEIFFTDGHIDKESAINEACNFLGI